MELIKDKKTNIKIGVMLTTASIIAFFLLKPIDIEEIRKARAEEATQNAQDAGKQEEHFRKLRIQYEACAKANSNTGKLVDCSVLEIETTEGSGNTVGTQTGGISPVPKRDSLNDKICTLGKWNGTKSPLCDNPELVNKLQEISKTKGVSFELMLGMTYAESHIGTHFTPAVCSYTNNWSGIKWAKLNDGTKVDQGIPNKDGCWLHTFKSVEEYWWSFANTLKLGYIDRGATTPEQISQYYVGTNGLVKYDWSQRVRQFYN